MLLKNLLFGVYLSNNAVKISCHKKQEELIMNNFTITIARGFGSGGKQIASEVAKQLGIHCYENRILTLASQYSGLEEAFFLNTDEKLRGGALISKLRELPRALNAMPVQKDFKSDLRLFEYQKDIICSLADTESCVIVGKCADHILKGRKNVFSFYIEAPRPFCRNRVMNRLNVTDKEADKLISSTDKYRADYYKYYTGGNYWTNPVNYDLTLNSEKVGIDGCVDLILYYVKMHMV